MFEWAKAFPDSFPPIVINITDGMVTDSPYDGADLGMWAKRLTTIGTGDGQALLFNIFWRYASHDQRLIHPEANQNSIVVTNRSYLAGPALYVVDFALALVNVWARWCALCVAEFPELVSLSRRLGNRDFARRRDAGGSGRAQDGAAAQVFSLSGHRRIHKRYRGHHLLRTAE